MRWELPVENGKLVVSIRPPRHGVPPWALISATSDPLVYKSTQFWKDKCKDATELTKFHRWLMQEKPTLDSMFENLNIFHITFEIEDEISKLHYLNTPTNGTM